jgi:PAT family beta-lactamase induction signal transducer AmpG
MVAFLAFMVAFFSSSQDIVIDAYRADVLPKTELGAGAAVSTVGYRLAMLVSGALALILSDHLPWAAVYGFMAVLMLLSGAVTFWAPEPQEKVAPKSLKEAVWEPWPPTSVRLWMLVFHHGLQTGGRPPGP